MLSPKQLWEFDCKGFLLLEDFFAVELVESLLEESVRYRRKHYMQLSQLVERAPVFCEAMFHPQIAVIAKQIFKEYRIGGSVLVINPAKTGGTVGMKLPAWHHDADHGEYPYHATAWPCPLLQLRFFISLSDVVGPEDGGLALMVGSHRSKAEWPYSPEAPPEAGEYEVPVAKKGDCMIMHHACKHTALPNTSDRDRINIQFIVVPLWVRSKEAEAVSAEFLQQMEPARRELLVQKW